MRRILDRLGVRGGVAVGLTVVVLVAVAIARLASGEVGRGSYNSGVQPSSTVDPTSGDDAEVIPTPSVYPDDADVKAAATAFTAAWLRRELAPTVWHSGVAALATESLAEDIDGADPAGVPATRTVGEPSVPLRTDRFAQVVIPVDTGTLLLTLLKEGNRWLVDGVDVDLERT